MLENQMLLFIFQGESLRIAFDAEQFSRNFYKHFHVITDYFVLFFLINL